MRIINEEYEIEIVEGQYIYYGILDDRGETNDSVFIEWEELTKDGLALAYKHLGQAADILKEAFSHYERKKLSGLPASTVEHSCRTAPPLSLKDYH